MPVRGVSLQTLLERAELRTLDRLLGPDVAQLLRAIDPALATAERLRPLLSELTEPLELVCNDETRAVLLNLMEPAEVKRLAACFGIRAVGDLMKALRAIRPLSPGSAKCDVFCEFFAIDPEPNPSEPTRLLESEVVEAQYGLFDHQRRAAQEVIEALSVQPCRVLLHMPTGSGKTRTAMHVAATHLRSQNSAAVLWLAFSAELCEQAADEFQRAWGALGDRDVSLYRFWGSSRLNPAQVQDGMIVAGLSKVHSASLKSDFLPRLADRVSLVIFDEAHQALAPTYRTALETAAVKRPGTGLLGLSATPGRTWNDIATDRELAALFNERKVTLSVPGYCSPVDYLVDEGYLARATFQSLSFSVGAPLCEADKLALHSDLDIPLSILNRLGADVQRNLLIVSAAEALLDRSHVRILVFAPSVRSARLISIVLRARGHDSDVLTSKTDQMSRHRILRKYKGNSSAPQILVNYGVLTTGFDAPRTSAAIIGRPTKSLVLFSQMIGRAIRGPRAGGNETAEIVSVIDTDLPGFRSPAEAFRNWEDVWR